MLYRDSIPVTTANISKGGFLINTNRWLQEGCVIQLHFSFGPDRHPLTCIAKIIWHAGRGPQHKTGVKIISADPSELYPFKHFIDGLPSSKKIAKR